MAVLSIHREELAEQPILFIQRRVARSDLQPVLAECFGRLFGHAHKAGLAVAGAPLARYHSPGPGLLTVDIGMPLAQPAAGEGDMQAGFLPGGAVAKAVHGGPYEELQETYAALEKWIGANGFRPGGAPWESYVTDPAEFPNPADWRTEVFWPLAK